MDRNNCAQTLRPAGLKSCDFASASTPQTWQECLLQRAENLRAEAHKLETLARAMREPIYPPEADAVLRELILTGLHR